LKEWILRDDDALNQIEAVVHPLVQSDREDFLVGSEAADLPLVVLDIPLLFERGIDEHVDAVLVVSVPADIQRERVLARPGMTKEAFEYLLSKQLSDAKKRELADFVIQTIDKESARAAVFKLVERLTRDSDNA
jgi:dephospho-CoA kinase